MINKKEHTVLKSCTGLEGGGVASGSTCGVVTGGALGIAMDYEQALLEQGIPVKKQVLSLVGDYARWFEESYGTALCREKSRADFYSTWSQLKYFLTVRSLSGCFWHIRGAGRHLYEMHHQKPDLRKYPVEEMEETAIHCAQTVRQGVRKNTGLGDDRLEHLSFVFDGGVGLSGGLCGAAVGAILSVNLLLGLKIRESSYWNTIKAFTVGHVNLLREKPAGKPEPFLAGREVVEYFRKHAGAMECSQITGRSFSGWNDFQEYIGQAESCGQLMDLMIRQTSDIILKYK